MVEAVHASRSHALIEHITVPTFPNSGGTVVHRIEPAWVFALEEQFIGNVHHSIFRQCIHQDGSAQETSLQAVAVVGEVLTQAGNHIFFRFAFHQAILQGEEGRGLHGVEDDRLECAVRIHECILGILLCLCLHLFILSHVTACGFSHFSHHARIHSPIASTQVVPIVDCFRLDETLSVLVMVEYAATATFKRFVAQPVAPLVIAILVAVDVMVIFRFIKMVEVFLHGNPTLIDDLLVVKLLPNDPRHNDTGVRPA